MKLLNSKKKNWNRIAVLIIGFISLAWFLIRVIPKPSRATYPCQRAAFPFASAFIIWIIGTFTSIFSFRKAKENLKKSNYFITVTLIFTAVLSFVLAWFIIPEMDARAEQLNQQQMVEPAPTLINQKRMDEGNLSTPLSYVSIVKSDKENSSEIDYTEIEAMIREAVNKTDDFKNLIRDNITVVIKPNIVSDTDWSKNPKKVPAENNGMVTDWRVIKAVVKLVRELNPNGKIYVVEGSADNTTRKNMLTLNYSAENFPGVTDIIYLDENSGNWEEWNSDKLVKVALPAEKALYADKLKPNKDREFYMNKIYHDADVLISVPVLKNHSMTSVTGSVKNVGIGATPQNIYGGAKGDNHRYINNRIDHNNYTNLHKFIHDYYLCRPVDYAIMEGLQGNENGPVAEQAKDLASIQKNMRLIIAGKDPLAVDAIASLLMCYNPAKVNHLAYLHNDTVGCIDPKYIRVLGPDINTMSESFKHFAQTGPKFNDILPPDASLKQLSIQNNELQLSLAADQISDIMKVEIVIDDAKYKLDVIADFEDIRIDISEMSLTDSVLQIKVYDEYLNCKTINQKGELLATGINTLFDHSMKLYPNPANDRFSINVGQQTIQSIEIYDLWGQLIQVPVLQSNEAIVNRKYLPSGDYLVKIETSKTWFAQKIRFE